MFSHVTVRQVNKPRPYHDPCYITGVILLWLSALVVYFLTIASLVDLGVFRYGVGELNAGVDSRLTNTNNLLTPAPWVFSVVWAAIFLYELVFLCYMISVVVRKSRVTGQKLYQVTAFIPVPVLYLYIFNNTLLSVWYFVAELRNSLASLAILTIDVFITLGAYASSLKDIYQKYPKLHAAGFRREDRLVVGIVLNSFGLLLTWLIIATHVNLTSVLQSMTMLNKEMAAAFPLTLLIIIYAIYIFLDLAMLEKYFRFLYAPHLPFVLASIGTFLKQYSPNRSLSVFLAGFMIVVVAVVPLKVCLDFYRERKRPRFGDERLEYEQVTRSPPLSDTHPLVAAAI